ncbi:invasion associated locus B family protein [Devosia sp. XJ19-1]|uniref:Invasion associated locus B family protein n=1 Tax=Devosia ureilytica TaxID=2952754 RepID=A0A9Q4AN41_9HYPH|nr:invasion associated locus B family protein [Devosia ureilytica]MCP8882640.1 invasion associated locus B family protein [Devosia ureilytica]MCP8886992.1 invasion associated locus B family protein [Devosia ureilytica]
MKRIATIPVFATVLLGMVTGALADNFALAVPGPSGLELEFRGYGRSGSEIFSETASITEIINGQRQYAIRVDEDILTRDPLVRWCVTDPTGTWLPAKGAADFTVCDESPSERSGTYGFEVAELMPRTKGFVPTGVETWWGPDDPVTEWTRFCLASDDALCIVRRDFVDGDGAIKASLVLRSLSASDEYVVQARVPNGGLVHEPTSWQIDQREAFKVQYHYCQAAWCVIQAMASGQGIGTFKRGNQVVIATRDRSNQPQSLSFGLDGFTRGFDGPGTTVEVNAATPAGVDMPTAHDWQERCEGDTCIYLSTTSGSPKDVPAKLLLRLSKDKPALLVASAPNGMRLSGGMIFRYGDDQANRINYIICDSAFCSAQVQLNEEFYDLVVNDNEVSIEFVGLDDEEFTATFEMAGLKALIEED